MSLCVILDTHIHFDPSELPEDLINKILSRLNVPNPRKKIAQKEFLYNADSLPDTLELWNWDNPRQLILPRGFIFEFEKILDDNGIDYKWEDVYKTTSYFDCGDRFDSVPEIPLRDYQLDAVSQLMVYSNGIYSSSTGSGKTRVMLDLIRQCQQPTIVICEKKDIKFQWEEAARDLGFELDENLTIVLRQTLWAARNEIGDDWYKSFGMVIWDENHHLSAETAFELIQKFPAYYRFGCSATPDTDKDLFPIIRAVIGPVVKHSSPEEIGNHLVTPLVRVIKTEFDFPYRPTIREGKKIFRNNYNSLLKALEGDENRNILITNIALENALEGHTCIILSKRKKHLENLAKEIQNCINAFCEEWKLNGIEPAEVILNVLTGNNSSDYDDIKNDIDSYECGSILFSTLAFEGTDIPRLDRLFLAYPGRKLRGYEQAIGRIMRPHSEKADAIVYDFRDVNVSILNSQYRLRAQQLYHKKKYEIIDG
jgi:superfamily II DNA or RNA helicase